MNRWKVRTTKRFDRDLGKIDRKVASRIIGFLEDLEQLDNPRDRGKALTGERAGVWSYRVGDYRILARVFDNELVILAIGVGHRSRIYRDDR